MIKQNWSKIHEIKQKCVAFQNENMTESALLVLSTSSTNEKVM
jgi:hypothetical protein